MTLVPLFAQIFPRWIDRNDKCDLLHSQPALDALLAFDCVVNVLDALEMNERSSLYFAVNPEPVPVLCSRTLRMRLLVTPMYKVFERFVMK
jgi:hypothetical protein